MKFARFFQYFYLAFAILFIYDGTTKWNSDRTGAYVSLALAVLAVFIFFFRRNMYNKYSNKDKS
ncbi:MAG: hypothetical protein ACK5MZ_03980 [Aestuariibaculum sp.]